MTKATLFPCPTIMGKGILVQATLWGNLILGPTARDVHNPQTAKDTNDDIMSFILAKCQKLVPSIDVRQTIHTFSGARAKNSTGDWIIGPCPTIKNGTFIHAAGIDSPGLAGSPAIALKVIEDLKKAGLDCKPDPSFNPNRAPLIRPKNGFKGLRMGTEAQLKGVPLDKKVICKCEKVTEAEVVDAMRRSLPIDSTQAIRKRVRAGMGHCQGDPDNYCCETRVAKVIARENGISEAQVGRRPWPATSLLPQRWITDDHRDHLHKLGESA